MPYTTFNEIVDYVVLPPQYVVEAGQKYVDAQIRLIQGSIDARLKRLWAVPFSPVPDVVKGWIAAIIAPKLLERRQIDPTDLQFQALLADAKLAQEQIDAAASDEDNPYDFPPAENVEQNSPVVGVSQYDPTTWTRVQADRARDERCTRKGTTRG